MFKGLRSKLEDEAKRIQSTVTHYGENLANQVRSSASEAGSDISGRARKFLDNAQQQDNEGGRASSSNALIADDFLNQIDNVKPQRRLSNASLESGSGSILNAQVVPNNSFRSSNSLIEIASDTESNPADNENTDFDQLDEMPRDKLNTMFQRFQSRAVNYKQKYKELASIYREVENENEKYRNMLSEFQDKATLRITKLKSDKNELKQKLKAIENDEKADAENDRIKKLQELLIKCKDEITSNRARITTLNDENEVLKKENSSLSSENSSNVQRVTAEWKGRFDRQEEEWNKRITECEENATIAIATSKAEMHSALQQKDQELENWISKFHALEMKDEDENAQLKAKLKSLEEAIMTLEQEKADMVQKLSEAKQEGVKLVKESEERRYNDTLTSELKKRDDEWGSRLKEMEEQMQLSVEENDMQRKTIKADHERVIEALRERIVELEKNNANMVLKLHKQEEELNEKFQEISHLANNETSENSYQQQQKISEEKLESEKKKIVHEHLEKIALIEKQYLEDKQLALSEQQNNLKEKYSEEKKVLVNNYEEKIALLEKENKEAKDYSLSQQKIFEENLEAEKIRIINENSEKITLIEKQYLEAKQLDFSKQQNNLEEKYNEEKKLIINEYEEKIALIEKENKDAKDYLLSQQKNFDETLVEEKGRFVAENLEKISLLEKKYLEDKQLALSELEEKYIEEKKILVDKYEKKIALIEKENLEAKDYSLSEQEKLEKANKEVNELQNHLKESDKKSERLAAEFADERSKIYIELNEMKETLTSSQQLKSQLQLELKNAKLEIKRLQETEKLFLDKNAELEEVNKEIISLKSAKNEEIKKLKNSLAEAKEINSKEIAAIKKESEKAKQKAVADMKSEIKHLYDSINEKDCELASTHADISKLRDELNNLRTEMDKQNNSDNENEQQLKKLSKGSYDDDGVVDLDEYVDLKRRFIEQEEELQLLRSVAHNGVKKNSPNTRRDSNRSFNVGGSDLLNFAEPTEAEYLRNVLYRYMIEREYLGRESVTLAKVICTVCKFPPEQRTLVLRREEARCQRWLPGSIHALNLHQSQINQRNSRQNSLNNWNISSSALLQTNNSDRPLSSINALPPYS